MQNWTSHGWKSCRKWEGKIQRQTICFPRPWIQSSWGLPTTLQKIFLCHSPIGLPQQNNYTEWVGDTEIVFTVTEAGESKIWCWQIHFWWEHTPLPSSQMVILYPHIGRKGSGALGSLLRTDLVPLMGPNLMTLVPVNTFTHQYYHHVGDRFSLI